MKHLARIMLLMALMLFALSATPAAAKWYVPDLDSDSSGMVMPGDNIRLDRR